MGGEGIELFGMFEQGTIDKKWNPITIQIILMGQIGKVVCSCNYEDRVFECPFFLVVFKKKLNTLIPIVKARENCLIIFNKFNLSFESL